MARSWQATVLGCALALGLGPPATAGATEEPAVSQSVALPGRQALVRWVLNADLSEDPREKMREAAQKRGPGGRMGGGGGMPRGGMPGGGMGRPGGMDRGGGGMRGGGAGPGGQPGSPPPMMAFFSVRELTITHTSPAVAIVEPDGLVRTLQPDGEYQVEHGEGELRTRWKGDRLVVETETERGKVKETWSVSPQTGRLTVRLELESGGGRMPGIQVDRVYDRVDE